MRYRDLLLALIGYPEPPSTAAIDDAVAIADLLGARISAAAFEVEIPKPVGLYTGGILDVEGMIAEAQQKSVAYARDLLTAFEAAAGRHQVLQDHVLERCTAGEVPDLLVEHARVRDITIIPVRDGQGLEQWYAEGVIFGSGRPTLILPEASHFAQRPDLDTIVVAWDYSRAAARAIADALPLLERARKVCVVTITREKAISSRRTGTDLARHLARHGLEIVLDEVEAGGRSIGECLEAHIASRNAALLVMGAYGHSRLRDFVLGGATRSMLAQPPVPLFLSH